MHKSEKELLFDYYNAIPTKYAKYKDNSLDVFTSISAYVEYILSTTSFKKIIKKIESIDCDYIICDLTDDPVSVNQEDFVALYKTMFKQITKKIKHDAIVAVQAGTPTVHEGNDSYAILTNLAKKYGKNVSTKLVDIPLFGEEAAFIFFEI